MTRAEAVARSLAALRFFHGSDQSGSPEATGYRGFYYHFLDLRTGARVWRSELSTIDTALLIAGALAASMYFDASTPDEIELRELVDVLYRRIDWRWAQGGEATIRQGWKPECGFLHYGWEGYSEAIVLYVLALGSPTHPLRGRATTRGPRRTSGRICTATMCSTRGRSSSISSRTRGSTFAVIQDRFMREKRSDYFENSRRATYVQREYAQRNPREFAGYGEHCWGLTAGDGPSDELPEVTPTSGAACSATPPAGCRTDRTTERCPAAAVLASLPFAPEIVLPRGTQHDCALSGDAGRSAVRQRLQSDSRRPGHAARGYRAATTDSTRASW